MDVNEMKERRKTGQDLHSTLGYLSPVTYEQKKA